MQPQGIQMDNVSVVFETAAATVTAVKNVTQQVPHASFVSIVGPSGCGKSTLLAVIAGLQKASSGSVSVAGKPVTGPDPKIGVVFQEDSTLPWRTVEENVRFAMQMIGVDKSEQRKRAKDAVDLVGLAGFEKSYPSQLSGGMRQRVALARTLAVQPEVVLMDEPFAALDQQTRLFLGAEVRQIWARTNQTIVFVTHDISEAILLSQQVWVMSYRPGTIIDVVDIDLPENRDASVVSTPQFNELHNRIWSSLQAESMRGFKQQETAAT
ncbi:MULTISPECIES: ABC transporter ATP-binding protein [Mycolicibacterium]|jgi:NitT/TauT family transport system ATP-binding protein|uniref:ABC transporter n=2 Tax=Mycolicibacterium TaxID=1866885 RepID=A0A378TFH0_9MYCO|nr:MULTISPECIES: ABC transporter ATP-binding protein [Mycolicibacterium]ANW63026.1 nitrate ABC transporter ATP-binding protein [Mycobacterium sp. djl-10]MCV7180929.1 ABC transporter ATP-binding protein [Mycolicibacterium murale]STZ58625.1 ABC transporter [Mycolicibacterium tokaiense]BBY86869.1 ATP-binding protein [Mycolicibacterium tokaiense]GFG61902.1 ATP-binding protein [Mycolicibacterium murale]